MKKDVIDPETSAKITLINKKEYSIMLEKIEIEQIEKKYNGCLADPNIFWPPFNTIISQKDSMSVFSSFQNRETIALEKKFKPSFKLPEIDPVDQNNNDNNEKSLNIEEYEFYQDLKTFRPTKKIEKSHDYYTTFSYLDYTTTQKLLKTVNMKNAYKEFPGSEDKGLIKLDTHEFNPAFCGMCRPDANSKTKDSDCSIF